MGSLPPGIVLLVGALLVPVCPRRLKPLYLLALPVLSALHLLYLRGLSEPVSVPVPLFDYTLELVRIDGLSFVFGVIFHVAAVLSTLFALRVRDDWQQVAGLMYAGSAIAAVFAGDLITLFVFWEATAVSSVFLIWAARDTRSCAAGSCGSPMPTMSARWSTPAAWVSSPRAAFPMPLPTVPSCAAAARLPAAGRSA